MAREKGAPGFYEETAAKPRLLEAIALLTSRSALIDPLCFPATLGPLPGRPFPYRLSVDTVSDGDGRIHGGRLWGQRPRCLGLPRVGRPIVGQAQAHSIRKRCPSR